METVHKKTYLGNNRNQNFVVIEALAKHSTIRIKLEKNMESLTKTRK